MMKSTRVPLSIALLSLAWIVLAYFGTNIVVAPMWQVFQDASGLETARTIAQVAASLTTVCLFLAAVLVAIPTALEPGGWLRKSLHVLPAYLVGFTFAAVLANLLGIATLGSLLSATSPIKLSLATAWLVVGAVLSSIAVAIAAARVDLRNDTTRAATTMAAIALVPGLILCLATIGSIAIVTANQSILSPGGGAGDSGGLGDLVTQLEIGGGLMAVLGVVALVSLLLGLRAGRRAPAAARKAAPASKPDYRREIARSLVAGAGISLVAFAAIQLVPVSRDNPPARGVVQWDTPQTQALVTRACMNCHSNETVWPWYASFAPGSWITAIHVNGARQQFNLSELDKISAARKRRLVSDMVDQIRNSVMPPFDYQLLHPEARLTTEEKEELIQGLENSLK